jgi:putative transposase
VSPERRRQAVERIRGKYGLSERHACRIAGQPRGTQRYTIIVRADEDALTQAIIALACSTADTAIVGLSHCWTRRSIA